MQVFHLAILSRAHRLDWRDAATQFRYATDGKLSESSFINRQVELRHRYLNVPNVLSVLRGLCGLIFLWAALTEHWLIAFTVAVYAVVSDLIDGPIARRFKQATNLGTRIDHTADFAFVFIGLVSLALYDGSAVPLLLPVFQLCAFLEYAYTGPQTHTSLLPSRLGKYNGILYFVVVVTTTTQYAFQLHWIPSDLIFGFCWLLVASTIASIALRVMARIRKTRENS